jgi:hypothetical protein
MYHYGTSAVELPLSNFAIGCFQNWLISEKHQSGYYLEVG